jgi:hypothetical protein
MKYIIQSEMPFIPRDDAFTLLEPLFGVFRESVLSAWQRWDAIGRENPDLKPTARATCISNFICAEIKRRFEGMEGATVTEQGGCLP